MYDACVPWPERPKGLKLEVGARRAPKLLVLNKRQLEQKYFGFGQLFFL